LQYTEEEKMRKYERKKKKGKEERKKGKRERERKVSQLLTATEIVIWTKHRIQLRQREGSYLSDRNDRKQELL